MTSSSKKCTHVQNKNPSKAYISDFLDLENCWFLFIALSL